ncbi:MAG: class I SAM-dependent methyltransferase [Acidobacteria bacterium]|nr:class I SAM-dependent methyltransferase [Acidobacteriota bacterium]
MRAAKMGLYRLLQKLGLLPSLWMIRSPIKIHEFVKLVGGARLAPEHVALDLGCGKALQTQLLARRCRKVIGIDISEKRLQAARQLLEGSPLESKVELVSARIQDARLPAASLDRVFSFCVLEHIPELAEVLAELYRLLKPGGEMHVSVDSLGSIDDPALLARHRREHAVHQYFTPDSLRRQLEEARFEVLEISPILTSRFSHDEFVSRISEPDYGYGFLGSALRYRKLRRHETSDGGAKGIMLIARARRPGGPGA